MEFEFVESKPTTRIKVIGIGGAGKNAINNMITSGLEGVTFVAANTDAQDLERALAPVKMQLGIKLTHGQGCGADPEKGRQAAMEDVDLIKETLTDTDMVFITAGMGGGTGTGGAPVVAEALKDLKDPPLVVAVVTKPFGFEGQVKMRQAEAGIQQLKQFADTIITIPNERLKAMAPRGAKLNEAFKLADDVLRGAVKGISDIILLPGYVNVDFQDAKRVMSYRGQALMGTGQATGPDRAKEAAGLAISSPLLDDVSIQGAQGLLVNISVSEWNISLDEVEDCCSLIQKEVHPEAIMIYGVAWDNSLGEDLRVTVIATGIGQREEKTVKKPAEDKKPQLATLEEVARHGRAFDRPARERLVEPPRETKPAAGFRGPRYSKYEHYGVDMDEEVLERPTFMRINAD